MILFKVGRGIKQGSVMLYAISLVLIFHIIGSTVKAFTVFSFDSFIVSSTYADDVIVFVNNQRDVNTLENIVESLGVVSAAMINWRP